jgi:hypothetical protein
MNIAANPTFMGVFWGLNHRKDLNHSKCPSGLVISPSFSWVFYEFSAFFNQILGYWDGE